MLKNRARALLPTNFDSLSVCVSIVFYAASTWSKNVYLVCTVTDFDASSWVNHSRIGRRQFCFSYLKSVTDASVE